MLLVRFYTTLLVLATAAVLAAPASSTPLLASAPPKVSYEKAKRILLREVVRPASLQAGDDLIAFRRATPLRNGQVVAPFLGEGPSFRAKGRWWFFWVDDEPLARFAHPSRYVFVNATTGRLKVVEQSWWPLVDGASPWFAFESYWSGASWAYSTLAPREPAAPRPEPPARGPLAASGLFTDECALIVDGAGDEKLGTPQDANGMAEAMDLFGYSYVQLKHPTSKAEVVANLRMLADNGCKDMLVYISSHGSNTGVGSAQIGNDWLSAAELYEEMARYPGVDFKVVVDTCYSGAWIKTLQLFGEVGKKTKLIIASSLEDELSYGDTDGPRDPNPADVGGEFSSGLIEDLKAIPGDPALLARVQDCLKLGRPLLVCKLGLAFESALEKDEGARTGKTSPRKVVN